MAVKSRKRRKVEAQKHNVTAGTVIRMESASSTRKPRSSVAVEMAQEIVHEMAQEINPVGGFVGFLREHAIVGLAVGFAIATQVQSLVKQLIASFIDPLYGLFFSQKLSEKKVILHWHGRAQPFGWGAFVYTMIDFLFVLLVIYLIVKFFKLDKLDKLKKEKE